MAVFGPTAKNDIPRNSTLSRLVPGYLKLVASLIFVLIAGLQYYRSFTTTTNHNGYQDDNALLLEGRELTVELHNQHGVSCSETTNTTLLSSSTTGAEGVTQASFNNNNELPELKVDEKNRTLVLIHVGTTQKNNSKIV